MRFLIREVHRWDDLNAYEGQLHGEVDGTPLCVHIVVSRPQGDWEALKPGSAVEVDIWLERSADIRLRSALSPPVWKTLDGPNYLIGSTVSEVVDDETIVVAGPFPLRVDMDRVPSVTSPPLGVGDGVEVRGLLKAELI